MPIIVAGTKYKDRFTIEPDRDYGPPGSYRPSYQTTGPDPSIPLTTLTQNVTLSTPGQILQNVDVHGKISVTAANVTIRNCIARGRVSTGSEWCIQATNAAVKNLRIEYTRILPEFPGDFTNGVGGHDFTLFRSDIQDCVDPVDPFNAVGQAGQPLNIVIDQNWMHDLLYWTPDAHADGQTHNDIVQIQGGTGLIMRGNSVEAYYGSRGTHQPALDASPTPSGAPNLSLSCVLLNSGGSFGATGGHVFEDNWFMGGFQPLNFGGGGAGANLGRAWRNRFSRDAHQPADSHPSDPWTIVVRADQTLDTGDGTPNQNVYDDNGSPIYVRHNG
ncbi:hypothetical protein [Angustibacter luteus]|uniref:Right-handed parallel beta-helix repeat-containing protein n=1 Tax=Angustibacter luteus TaxID=658456 RepID=A0ABW1JJT7_9ACTN